MPPVALNHGGAIKLQRKESTAMEYSLDDILQMSAEEMEARAPEELQRIVELLKAERARKAAEIDQLETRLALKKLEKSALERWLAEVINSCIAAGIDPGKVTNRELEAMSLIKFQPEDKYGNLVDGDE